MYMFVDCGVFFVCLGQDYGCVVGIGDRYYN